MADKKYRLSFEMTDGTKQSVEFAVPQGESVTPDYAAAEGEPGHILNRTHWVEKVGMVEILPDTTIEYNEDEGHMAYIPSLVLEVGKTYIVKWNGTEYTCVVQDVSAFMETEGAVALGDLSDFGLNGNGEPFILLYLEGTLMAETDTTEPITISIKTDGKIVHKLDPKYLPDNVPSIFNVDFDIDFSGSEVTATTTIPFSVIYAKASDPNIIVRGIGTSSLVEAKMEFQLSECSMNSINFVYTQVESSKIEFYAFSVQPDNSVTVSYKRVM